jgi:hypothetical protein
MSFLSSPTTLTLAEGYIAFQLFSAVVQSLPQPTEVGGIWYKSFYNFLSILVADFKSFLSSKGALPLPPGSTITTATSTETRELEVVKTK